MKARGSLLAAGAVLIALLLPAGAAARVGAHQRHVEVVAPTNWSNLLLGNHDGYTVGVVLEEPDLAVLTAVKYDRKRIGVEETQYGTHFKGSLAAGRLSADFGPIGSLAVRFQPGGTKERQPPKGCEGKSSRREAGRWVGKVSLRGEGGYFAVSAGSAEGERDRTFRLRCRVKREMPKPAPESLRARIEPKIGASLVSIILGTISSVEAANREGGRRIELRAAHASGTGPGAEVEAGAFEYQGAMPVGRTVQMLSAPPGSLVTSLPGEHPATATLKPSAPFSGEASYRAVSPTDHSWTGSLAVHFPGLVAPLAGPRFFSSFCVISPLVTSHGCEYQSPNWQSGEESTVAEAPR
ncbi:MAG: hypothetical protein J0H06_02225 [Actinobacteria bacterium]|nr:hypothetical protein [Actinomycetota bacterium]